MGVGFVPSGSKFDGLKLQEQLQAAMVSVNNVAVSLESPNVTEGSQPEDSKIAPKGLSKHQCMFRQNICKDKVVSQLYQEVVNFGEHFKPTGKPRFNLNRLEHAGLKELTKLVKDGKIVICQADKGGMIVLLPPDQVKLMVKEHLEKSNNYKCVGQVDPLTNDGLVSKNYFDGWREAFKGGYINASLIKSVIGLNVAEDGKMNKSTLDIYKAGTPYFYVLPKVHKFKDISQLKPGVHMPSRLVTALHIGLTVRGDKYINANFLGPLASDYCLDRVKDYTQFLQRIEEFSANGTWSGGHIVTIDVVSLYDNLSRDLINCGIKDAVKKYRPDWKDDFVIWLIKMINDSLDSVFDKFGSDWYHMTDCVPTGHTLSVHLADIAMYYALNSLVYSKDEQIFEFFARFVDDTTSLYAGDLEPFQEWLLTFRKDLKESYGLEVTCEIVDSQEYSPFLEVKYKFIEGSVLTNVYQKPTDAHSYLNYNSCHPRHVFRSIVYSQALRHRKIINNNELSKDKGGG